MKYNAISMEKRVVETVVNIKCNEVEYLNGELDKHIRCALRQQANKIIIEIVSRE